MTSDLPSQKDEFQIEYQEIKSDLKKIILINLLVIVLLVGLYFFDKKTSFLEKLQNLF